MLSQIVNRRQMLRLGGSGMVRALVSPAPKTVWHTLKLGASGFVTGLRIGPDGTMVCRTDVGGAYVWNGKQWVQTMTTSSFPDWALNSFSGVYAIAPAPSNTSILYMYFSDNFSIGYVYKSIDKGGTWVRAGNFPKTFANSRGYATKYINHRIAIDPRNPDIVYVGTPSGGLFRSGDGGIEWDRVTAVGTGAKADDGVGGGHTICFDPSSSMAAGVTQGIYVMTYGVGVYRSTDGGAHWTLINSRGMPTTVVSMTIDQFGLLWVCDTGTLNLWNGFAWSHPLGEATIGVVAVDPASDIQATSHVFALTSAGGLFYSTNGGSSFSGPNGFVLSSPTIPALEFSADTFLSASMIEFNPISGLLVMSCGIGVFTTKPAIKSATITWTALSEGIEELVTNWAVSPPGGNLVVAAWDRPVWVITNPDEYPLKYYPSSIFNPCWSIDWASNDPTTLVAIIGGQGVGGAAADYSGVLTDGGKSYARFPSVPATLSVNNGGRAGSIAASNTLNFVWVISDNTSVNGWAGGPYYTVDGGSSWHPCSTGQSGQGGWGPAYYNGQQNVCADRVEPNMFYIENDGGGTVPRDNGIYRSSDGGVTWRKVFTGALSVQRAGQRQMRSVPGMSGNLFFSGGPVGYASPKVSQKFWRSTNHGETWTSIPSVFEVWSFGFGKSAPGQNYPAVFICGWVNRIFGIFRSDDNCATWQTISRGLPSDWFDNVRVIEGDNNVYGTVYIGFSGTGCKYGQLQ